MTPSVVISDLHLGSRAAHGVLERPEVLSALVERLAGTPRLVLLGDVLELAEGRPVDQVLAVATPVLGALGAAIGPGGEIIVLAGNHDRRMLTQWITATGSGLGIEDEVPHDVSPVLNALTGALGAGGARVSVRYPGYRIGPRVWCHHGHYLDRLLSPEGPYGIWARPGMARPVDYERGRIPQQKPRPLSLVQRHLVRPGMARLTTTGLNWQMHRHSLPALGRVITGLGLKDVDHVIFGHVHRLGPLPGERAQTWQIPRPGAEPVHFHNTGSWVAEPRLLADHRPPHPYWPGGGVLVDGDGPPEAVQLIPVPVMEHRRRRTRRSGR